MTMSLGDFCSTWRRPLGIGEAIVYGGSELRYSENLEYFGSFSAMLVSMSMMSFTNTYICTRWSGEKQAIDPREDSGAQEILIGKCRQEFRGRKSSGCPVPLPGIEDRLSGLPLWGLYPICHSLVAMLFACFLEISRLSEIAMLMNNLNTSTKGTGA